jgi:hypothetical protein
VCAKNVILWELVKRSGEIRLTADSLKLKGEGGGGSPPRVFCVRVANKGLMLDAASRESTFGELNTETQSAQRSEKGMGTDLEVRAEGRARLAAIMGNDSTEVTYCQ